MYFHINAMIVQIIAQLFSQICIKKCCAANKMPAAQHQVDGLFHSHFLQKAVGVTPFVHQEEHVSYVHSNATRKVLIKEYVTRQAVPIAVEGEAQQFSLSIEYWRTAVAAGDVVVGKETKLQLACRLVGILAKVFCSKKLVHYWFGIILDVLVALFHLFNDAFGSGIIA